MSAPCERLPPNNLQERAQTLRAAGCERDDDRQLRHLAEAGADAAGAFYRRRQIRSLRPQLVERVLQRLLADLRRVGEQVPELLDLFLDGLVLFRSGRAEVWCAVRSPFESPFFRLLRWPLIDPHVLPAPVKRRKSRQIVANETAADPHSPRFAEIWITSLAPTRLVAYQICFAEADSIASAGPARPAPHAGPAAGPSPRPAAPPPGRRMTAPIGWPEETPNPTSGQRPAIVERKPDGDFAL